MSTCISRHGEYSEHQPGDWCPRCGVFNEEALVAERDELLATTRRLAQKIMNLSRDINEVLAPEILRQKAEAWDQGHQSASDCECGVINPNEDVNPYREQS